LVAEREARQVLDRIRSKLPEFPEQELKDVSQAIDAAEHGLISLLCRVVIDTNDRDGIPSRKVRR
jgi:hypothetical protein